MWSLRMCIMACACACAASVVVVNLPCEQPPCLSDSVNSNDDQYKDFIKSKASKSPEADPVSLDEGIVGEDYLHNPMWVRATSLSAQSLAQLAFIAGNDLDGGPLWVIRSQYGRGVIPGKLAINHRVAYIPFNGQEVRVENFEVLCASQTSLRWANIGCEFDYLPNAAISAGYNDCGEPLYIARCNYRGSTVPGKYNPKRGPAHISFDSREVFCWNIQVLRAVRHFSTLSPAPLWEEQAYNKSAYYFDN